MTGDFAITIVDPVQTFARQETLHATPHSGPPVPLPLSSPECSDTVCGWRPQGQLEPVPGPHLLSGPPARPKCIPLLALAGEPAKAGLGLSFLLMSDIYRFHQTLCWGPPQSAHVYLFRKDIYLLSECWARMTYCTERSGLL